MSEFKGTKGRWKVKHSESKDAFNIIGTVLGGNYKIARCPYAVFANLSKEWNEKEKSEAEANAKLIASAPEMLEMLMDIMEALKEGESYHSSDIEELISKITE